MAVTEFPIYLPPSAATLSDGSSGNATPQIERVQGTEANPKKHVIVARFDPTTAEYITFDLKLPPATVLGASPTAKLNLLWASIAAITSTNVVWAAQIGAVTPADADTPIEHASAAAQSVVSANNTTEAGRLISAQIAFSNAQADGMQPDDLLTIIVFRDAANGSDTLAEDARLYGAELVLTPLA